jgi:predicted nicotinamide N-methyase
MAVLPASGSPSGARSASLENFVLANTKAGAVPLVPEVRLYLGDDAIGIWELTEKEVGASDKQPPFWAFPWAGGQALARYVLDHREVVAGRSVLDIGSGSGLTAIAAALAGARTVLASEVDEFAIASIRLNAGLNGVRVEATGDVLDGQAEGFDVVLAADIWYERQLAARALGLLRRVAGRGGMVLAGDLGRAFLPRDELRELAAYEIPVVAELESASTKRAAVLTLR